MSVEFSEKRRLTLALSRVFGFGAKSYLELIEHYTGIDEVLAQFTASKLPVQLQESWAEACKANWEALLEQSNTSYVCQWEDTYPRLLRHIPDPPIVLFYKGDLEPLFVRTNLAVVGTRRMTKAGKELTTDFCTEIVKNGIGIISGMAFGIDSTAHLAALDSGGYTVAVLASPVSVPSPAMNEYVYRRILASGGAIVSEMFPETKVTAGMFASRNRIVAGLPQGTLVVEAGKGSGALITASVAFDYDREVFAVPGAVGSPTYCGCNQLIKEGKAHLVDSVEDIFQELNYPHLTSVQSEKQVSFSPEEERVINLLSQQVSSLDEICATVDIPERDALSLLSVLEVKGAVRTEAGYFMITSRHE
jgi:DNA processing protein